jgi:hypothetical protein
VLEMERADCRRETLEAGERRSGARMNGLGLGIFRFYTNAERVPA